MSYPSPYYYPPPPPPKRSGFGGCCGACLGLSIFAIVAVIGLAVLGAVAFPNLPKQMAASAATALSNTPTPTTLLPFDFCAIIPPGAIQTSNDPGTAPLYSIAEGEDVYVLYPYGVCYASYANGDLKISLQRFRTPANAQRAEKYVRTCPQPDGLYNQYTCAAINLGNGGFEIEGSADPTCGDVPYKHRLTWTRDCLLATVSIDVYGRTPTAEEAQQVRDLARQLETQLQTAPTCP